MTKKKESKYLKSKKEIDEIKFIEFKKNEQKDYKKCLKSFIEETNEIEILNPNENIDKNRDEDTMLNIFEWDTFKYETIQLNEPFVCLSPGEWLIDDVVFQSISAFIKFYELDRFISVFNPDIISMLIESKFKNAQNISYNGHHLNKQIIFVLLYGDNFGFKIKAHFILAIINIQEKFIVIMDSLTEYFHLMP